MKKLLVSAFAAISLLLIPALIMTSVSAGSAQRQACEGSGGNWRNGECISAEGASRGLTDIASNIINTLLFAAGIVAVIYIIIGGFRYITAQGDSSQITTAKNTILYAIIGLVVVIASFAIVNFVLDQF